MRLTPEVNGGTHILRELMLAMLLCVLAESSLAAEGDAFDKALARLIPVAVKAREAIVSHPSLHAFEIEITLSRTLEEAWGDFKRGEYSAARKRIAPLETSLGALQRIPYHSLQALLAMIAQEEGDMAERNERLVYRVALFAALAQTGNGESPESAFRAIFISDEDLWASMMAKQLRFQARAEATIGDRRYHIVTARTPSGDERKVYFDLSAMHESYRRISRAESTK